MRQSSRKLDALEVVFDDPNAVANGGLVLPMTLAERARAEGTGRRQRAPGRTPPGMPTLAKRR